MLVKKILFIAIEDEDGQRKGEAGWTVTVDGETVIEHICDTDMAANALNPLWEKLGLEVEFDYD